MAIFNYNALDSDGKEREGTIDASTMDLAIGALQRRNLIVSRIEPQKKAGGASSGLEMSISVFDRITNADIVMLSRQMSTLFEAQVSALRAFRLLASEARTQRLASKLDDVAAEIQSGSTISTALSHHPDVFSPFYVNMVRAGEESGKLDETFSFLTSYLERNYEITQKARNALIYPAFIVLTFFVVMTLMMTIVIPNLASMLDGLGQNVPLPTKIIIGLSLFVRNYIILILLLLGGAGGFLYRYAQTPAGEVVFARARLQTPAIGPLFRKIFLSRIADNLSTMLKSGIQILRALEITGLVVGDPVYNSILITAAEDVKGGIPLSEAFRKHPEIPGIMVAMIKIGEETGNMGTILDTIARFYRREVDNAVDTLVSLIEPILIVSLAVGVGILLAAVILPIYNISSSF
jgi:type IV pilus assembly protein PilC